MELFLREVCKVMFGWWWFCMDGQTKTANGTDRFILPVLIALLLGCLLAALVWQLR